MYRKQDKTNLKAPEGRQVNQLRSSGAECAYYFDCVGVRGEDGLENLAIVERIPAERTWVAWRLTELDRAQGKDIIRGLHFSLRE